MGVCPECCGDAANSLRRTLSKVQTITSQPEAEIEELIISETVVCQVVFLSPNQANPRLLVNM